MADSAGVSRTLEPIRPEDSSWNLPGAPRGGIFSQGLATEAERQAELSVIAAAEAGIALAHARYKVGETAITWNSADNTLSIVTPP